MLTPYNERSQRVRPIIGAEAANAFGTKARPAVLSKKLSRCASTTTKMPCGYASMSRVQVPVVTLGIALVFIAPYLLGKPEIPPRSSSLRKRARSSIQWTSTGMRRIRHNCSIKLTVGLGHTRAATSPQKFLSTSQRSSNYGFI